MVSILMSFGCVIHSKKPIQATSGSYNYCNKDRVCLKDNYQNAIWETKITKHIKHRGGVMVSCFLTIFTNMSIKIYFTKLLDFSNLYLQHFPMRIGKLIPDTLDRIEAYDSELDLHWFFKMHVAKRNNGEKYIRGFEWRNFLEKKNVRVGDIIEWEMHGFPILMNSMIVRKEDKHKFGYGGKKRRST